MSNGGAERVVSILANYLDSVGHEIRIITFHGKDDYILNESVKRVRLHKQPLLKSVVLNGFFSLFWFYRKKENRPDIISSHINILSYMTIPVAKLRGIKIIVSEHINHKVNPTFAKRVLRKHIYPMADALTILTGYDLCYYSKYTKNVFVMPNPCSFEIQDNEESTIHRKKHIVAIGDLNRIHHKGFDNLLHIVKEIIAIHPAWKFKILGGGEYGMKILKGMAKDMAIEKGVEFIGFTTDVKNILHESSIFILPSRFEGLPMSLLEAMSQGTPCIAYDCVSGPSDIIINEVNGLLIPDQNMEEMVSGLDRLISDPSLRAKFQKNAPASLSKFDIVNVGKKWEQLLSGIVYNKEKQLEKV